MGQKRKKLQMGLIYIEKAQQNPSMHACATAVFVCVQPFKLLRSAQIKWVRKRQSYILVLSTFYRKGSTKSEHACARYSRFVRARPFKLLRSAQIKWARK